jgi:hypothetical protein
MDEHDAHPERFVRYVVQPKKPMNTKPNDGGQAFPTPASEYVGRVAGMTLRDYFAAAALPQVIANCKTDSARKPEQSITAYFAETAYMLADAMLAARES